MNPFRHAKLLFLIAALLISASGQAQDRPLEQSYREIVAQPQLEASEKIEVIDFFWYGCPYCYQLMPAIEEWNKTKSADVVLRRVPAVLRKDWLPDAHLYYTLESLGEAERLHTKVFEAIHRERIQAIDIETWAQWAVKNGIDRQKWLSAYHSVPVREKVARAIEISRDYDVRGTPAMVVDGRYQTSGSIAGGLKNVMPTVEGLVGLARERRKK